MFPRKRPSPSQGLLVPNPQHVAVWSPLVLHIHSRYSIFPSILLSRIINQILSSSQAFAINPSVSGMHVVDPTYDHTLASWALWITDRWGNEPYAECEPHEIIKELLLGLGRGDNRTYVTHPHPTLSMLRLSDSLTSVSACC